ncbi:MAG: ATP-binding protein, partial [Candidatus Korarchaeota archaeon]|nr:ATP-binding protein [Candidatus Korarchaeota archaeon]NIU84090.1 ATP-binding protein [Candidatus Thorarchaeota archaeon]NIW14234.1 ATP-binding protein [Candidatus Thorarchaeota archaeon]NIW52326.1 ATP-binding protein [Candidatus Korarchaeota archaeon]
ILYRDVVQRSGIQKVDKIEKLKNFLLANLSNLLNYNNIAHQLNVSTDTISSYVREMERAYYIFPVPIFSYSLKKQQVNPKKIYCVDNGLRNVTGFRFSRDIGRLYENTVFLHLKRRI